MIQLKEEAGTSKCAIRVVVQLQNIYAIINLSENIKVPLFVFNILIIISCNFS